MRSISITHASRPGTVLSVLVALGLALPSLAPAAVFAPPPGTPTTTAPAPATPSTPAATTPAPAAPKTPAPTSKAPNGTAPKTTPKTPHGTAAPQPAAPATGAAGKTQTVPAGTARTSTESSSSNGNTALMIAFVAAVALLVGIAYMILRDAHSVAPVSEGPSGGGTRDPAARLRRRRRKAKVAKQSRKRNR